MPTIIDSLVLELGVDGTKLKQGLKELTDGTENAKKESEKHGKHIEAANKKVSDSIEVVGKKALALYAIFLSARGLKSFVEDIVQSDTALGRFARTLGETPQRVGGMGLIAERFGASAAGMNAALRTANDMYERLINNGAAFSDEFSKIQMWSNVTVDFQHGPAKMLFDIADGLHKIAKAGPEGQRRASFLARSMGLDDETSNLLINLGGQRLRELAKEAEKLAQTDSQIENSNKLLYVWMKISQEIKAAGRNLLDNLSPALTDALTMLDDWAQKFDWNKVLGSTDDWARAIKVIKEDFAALWDFCQKIAAGIEKIDKILHLSDGLNKLNAWVQTPGERHPSTMPDEFTPAGGGSSGLEVNDQPVSKSNRLPVDIGEVGESSWSKFWKSLGDVASGHFGGAGGGAGGAGGAGAFGGKDKGWGDTTDDQILATLASVEKAKGLKPGTLRGIYAGEGRAAFVGDNGTSFNWGQFHVDGHSMGDEMLKAGIDIKDKSPDGIRKTAEYVAKILQEHPERIKEFHGNQGADTGLSLGDGSTQPNSSAGIAKSLEGASREKAEAALGHVMTFGEWCSDFVNGVLEKGGHKGSGSAIATNFLNWGRGVNPGDVKSGDVAVEARGHAAGEMGGHAAVATGNVRRDANGNVTEIEMTSGNYGNRVHTEWVSARKVQLRRANDAGSVSGPTASLRGGAKMAAHHRNTNVARNNSSSVHIGEVHVTTQDAGSFGSDLKRSLEMAGMAMSFNGGAV